MKNCKKCLQEKALNEFGVQKSRGKQYANNVCRVCVSQRQKQYIESNKEAKRKRDSNYYERCKNTISFTQKGKNYRESRKKEKAAYDKIRRVTHKDEYKKYCQENKDSIAQVRHDYYVNHKSERKEYNKQWAKSNPARRSEINTSYVLRRLKTDFSFRLRSNVSRTINKYLKLNDSSKNRHSILEFLPYSIVELKQHLEAQFEPWMSWENWGKYDKTAWDDSLPSTWTWQIDHIIPQHKLPYASMDEENFKKTWALDNLRPLSSKQNLLDGVRKLR